MISFFGPPSTHPRTVVRQGRLHKEVFPIGRAPQPGKRQRFANRIEYTTYFTTETVVEMIDQQCLDILTLYCITSLPISALNRLLTVRSEWSRK